MGLKISHVSKSYGDKKVVNDINFEINTPGVFGLLGTNGAGKTTTIRMLLRNFKEGRRTNHMEWKRSTKETCQLWLFTRRKGNLS